MSAMKQDQIYSHVNPYFPPTSFSTPPLPMTIFTPCYPLSTPKSLSTPPHPNFVFFFEQSDTISFFVFFFSQVTLAVCFWVCYKGSSSPFGIDYSSWFLLWLLWWIELSDYRASVALLQDQSSVLSIQVGGSQLPLILVSRILFWTLWPPVCACAHIHTQTQFNQNNLK